ncbi:RNA polymerase sigma factor [Tunicatimonas pelagia]|uniref:RNA polymerase sigma factor n=1 Tax=Tunicatimonas pelagia TaxID=931531 RepID=UPI00266530A5|nr:RNA polymerase sigma-70 factor [Tunicatimonas pelagia]WKN44127.1 RNA polymerase sigma-70 factor [Tunicatimonas pelagia]
MSETTLIKRVSQGDHLAFKQIFNQHKDAIFGYSYKFIKSSTLAEETVQEVFLKIWQNRAKLDPAYPIKPYLYKVARNHVYNTLRNAAYSDQLKEQVFYRQTACRNVTEDQVVYRDLEAFQEQAIQGLPTRRQLIFRMSRTEGLSHEEIAQRLNISPNTVKDQITKALRTIKEQLHIHTDIAVSIAILFFL